MTLPHTIEYLLLKRINEFFETPLIKLKLHRELRNRLLDSFTERSLNILHRNDMFSARVGDLQGCVGPTADHQPGGVLVKQLKCLGIQRFTRERMFELFGHQITE